MSTNTNSIHIVWKAWKNSNMESSESGKEKRATRMEVTEKRTETTD